MKKKKVPNKIIKIIIRLNNKYIPKNIKWSAKDIGIFNKNCKLILILTWGKKKSLQLNIWTKKMSIKEMQTFFYQNFIFLAKIYKKATSDKIIYNVLMKFSKIFFNILKNFYK